jgi:putative flippase GtrA
MIRRELAAFIVNGLVSVAIAYGVYRGLVHNGLMIEVANVIAYLAGMAYGFFANKRLAFRNRGEVSIRMLVYYAVQHLVTLLVNLGVNSVAFGMLRGVPGDLSIAFMVAIACSTVLNFLGLKYWVFERRANMSAGLKNTGAMKT